MIIIIMSNTEFSLFLFLHHFYSAFSIKIRKYFLNHLWWNCFFCFCISFLFWFLFLFLYLFLHLFVYLFSYLLFFIFILISIFIYICIYTFIFFQSKAWYPSCCQIDCWTAHRRFQKVFYISCLSSIYFYVCYFIILLF